MAGTARIVSTALEVTKFLAECRPIVGRSPRRGTGGFILFGNRTGMTRVFRGEERFTSNTNA